MQRSTPALAVVLLLVLAGCSSFGGVDGTTRQPFDVEPTTTVDTATSLPSNATIADTPPVIVFNPVNDTIPAPFDLVEAHERRLSGRPYVLQYDQTRTYANGTTLLSEEATTVYGPNHSNYVQDLRSRFGNDSMHRQLYANGTHVWSLTEHDESTNASPELLQRVNGNPVPPSNVLVSRSSETVLTGLLTMSVTDVQALDVVPSDVDVPVYRVVLNDTRTPNPYGDETLDATLTLIVTEDGRIVEYSHEYTYVRDGTTVHVQTRVQYLSVDTATVNRPDWVPTNNSTATERALSVGTDLKASPRIGPDGPTSMPLRARARAIA